VPYKPSLDALSATIEIIKILNGKFKESKTTYC